MIIFTYCLLQMGKTSLVRALMSPYSLCRPPIALDNRTVGIDRCEMKLQDSSLPSSPTIDVQVWDLAGQDVYTLSHSVHFSHRCLYLLLWKPGEAFDATMRRLSPWLESLCTHVPDANVVLVASHCKTNITDHEFLKLSRLVQDATNARIQELNLITKLEVERLRIMLDHIQQTILQLQQDYADYARSSPDLANPDSAFLQRVGYRLWSKEAWAARASAPARSLPLSLRTRSAAIHDAIIQERLLCERLQLLLGIRDGGCPNGRDACKLKLHCHSVDSIEGHGVKELRKWLYSHCLSLPFVGEMISSNWTALGNVFDHFGDSVLSRTDAVALVRRHLPRMTRMTNLSDDALWCIIEFWSDVGRIFVHESQVVREPSALISLLKPLLHHEPLEMMTNSVYRSLLVDASLKSDHIITELQGLLQTLKRTDELPLQLLDHLSAWKHLSSDQRSCMLAFFERSRLLCRVEQRPDVRLISSRIRTKPHLTEDVAHVTSISTYHALYLLPLGHIGIIAHLHSFVSALSLESVKCKSGRDSLLLHRSSKCACAFSVEDYSVSVQQNDRFSSLHGLIGEKFSCVLRISCNDFGFFKFAAACADAAMDSCSFGSRFQCWLTVIDKALCGGSCDWTAQEWFKFRDVASSTMSQYSLSDALQRNHHSEIVPGMSIIQMLRPRSSIFVSHAWDDGTAEFIKRLKVHLEQQTLASVWVDQDSLNQQQETIISSFREALCQARVVFILLTPTYLTRANCLRELRWALDFDRAKYLKVVLLSLHPAVGYEGRLQLLQDGPLRGLVFSLKEKKVKLLCPEAMALVEQLNDNHMNKLPWHELQAWRSDEMKGDWEEHRWYDDKGTVKQVHLAGCKEGLVEQTVAVVRAADSQGHPWLVCGAPIPVSECVAMDNTASLTAIDVQPGDVPSELLRVELYPETAARKVLLSRQVQPGDAAWEQDSSRVSCPGPNCGRLFNMLNRRHHCRLCGRVMCGRCAPVMERVGSTDNVRCCAACFAA
jgi:hypothetical protein